jgi:hypothetical protein
VALGESRLTEIILRDERLRQIVLDFVGKLDIAHPWKITIERYKKKRSLSQNALYWKWVGIISDETGNDRDEVHEFFKVKFLTPTIIEMGDTAIACRTTTKLSTQDMSDFMEKVMAFSTGNLGILLPIPEEMHMHDRGM